MKTSLSWHLDCCWNSCPQNIFFCDFLLKSSFLFQFMENPWRTFDPLYSRPDSKFLRTFWLCCCFFQHWSAHLSLFLLSALSALDIDHSFLLRVNCPLMDHVDVIQYHQKYYQFLKVIHFITTSLIPNETLRFNIQYFPPVSKLFLLIWFDWLGWLREKLLR